jgi:hypothetical protein
LVVSKLSGARPSPAENNRVRSEAAKRTIQESGSAAAVTTTHEGEGKES